LSRLQVSAYVVNTTDVFTRRWMIDHVSSWSVAVWSSREAAARSLVGDVAQIESVAAEYDYDFYLPAAPNGQAALVTIPLSDARVVLPPGDYWIAAYAHVDVPVHAVTVFVWLNRNDNASVQVNPPGGFTNIPAGGADRVGDAGYRLLGAATVIQCGPADMGGVGAAPAADGNLDNNDFIVFIDRFFAQDALADLGSAGGEDGADGVFDNNDFIAFISYFFAGC
ncbi:MAG: hypothetical protein K2Q09_09510, partial [Phycisphaerales bacterium]|nr:hypothetical protein [Phycisphaerales bacterium]